jgi:deoxyribodipyrimidine photo-lyase
MDIPAVLQPLARFNAKTVLPKKQALNIDPSLPLLLYNSYNLDPVWRKEEKANRILVLEPSHFRQFPVSDNVLQFILSLAKNIDDLQVFAGEVNEIPHLKDTKAIYSKEHPAFVYYPGQKDERDWLFPEVKGSFGSFSSYWKKCKQDITQKDFACIELVRA